MNKILAKFRPHALKIKEAGGTLYIVGGAVRDFLKCKIPHDIDFCVTGLSVESFLKLFPEARQQGKQFPVFVVDDCEFAFARKERKNGIGHNGFEINSDPSITIEEDLYRRDLTINSIAVEVLHGTVIDPYNGLDDFNNGNLKATSEAFKEDPVRALRAARFNSEYDFRASIDLYFMINELKPELKLINQNLKLLELTKALKGKAPWQFFNLLDRAEVLDVIFPEVHALIGVPQAHHEDGDAYEHTRRVLGDCRKLTDDPVILFAALAHDFGKAATPRDELPAHHDHENRSVEIIDKIDWIPNEWKSFAKAVAYDHMRGHRFNEMRRGKRVALLERINKTSKGLDGFCKVLLADKPTPETMKNIALMHATYAKIYSISGNDLPENTPKGEVFGKVLHQKRSELIEL